MTMRINAEIKGLDGFIKKLATVKASYTSKYLRSAMQKSGTKIARDSRSLAPVRSGQLSRSMGGKTKVYRNGIVIGVVEPRKGFRTLYGDRGGFAVKLRYIDPRYYAHLPEFGTKPRYNRRGAFRGVMRRTPFLGPSFDANRAFVSFVFLAKMNRAVEDMVA